MNKQWLARALTAVALLGAAVSGVLAAGSGKPLPREIVIPGERVFPESLTSTREGSVLIGSIGARTIFRAGPGAMRAEVFIKPGTDGLQSIFGVLADDRSGTLWACSNTNPFEPPASTPAAPAAPAALYAFALTSGAPKGHFPFPTAGALCNDIAVAGDGTVYATDTANMQVVRLRPGEKSLAVWAGQGAFGPKGGVLDGIAVLDHRVIVGTLATSKLFSVPIEGDGRSGRVTESALDRPLERPDGIRRFGAGELLVVEGGGEGRLSRVTLRGDTGRALTLKSGYPDGAVAVTVVGRTAYVLEGQLATLMGGRVQKALASLRPKPFRATAVEVGSPQP